MTTIETDVLTIEEAAKVLRIGRNAAYALARQWRDTGGREGLPCIQLGRTLRVPSEALHDMLAFVDDRDGAARSERTAAP